MGHWTSMSVKILFAEFRTRIHFACHRNTMCPRSATSRKDYTLFCSKLYKDLVGVLEKNMTAAHSTWGSHCDMWFVYRGGFYIHSNETGHESELCLVLLKSSSSDVTLVAWNWPHVEYLHHGNGKCYQSGWLFWVFIPRELFYIVHIKSVSLYFKMLSIIRLHQQNSSEFFLASWVHTYM